MIKHSFYGLSVKHLVLISNFGSKQLKKIRVCEDEKRYLNLTVFLIFISIHELFETMIFLIESRRTWVARITLRSMLEGFINLLYILKPEESSNLRAVSFVLQSEKERKNFVARLDNFHKKYPDFVSDSVLGLETTEKREAFITAKEEEVKNFGQIVGDIPIWPHRLVDRVKAIDKEMATEADYQNGTMEYFYLTVYWVDSNYTHLNLVALDTFISGLKDSVTFKQIQPLLSEDRSPVLTAYLLYLNSLKSVNRVLGFCSDEELECFDLV